MVDKLGPEEFISLWDLTIDKMVRYHDNISMELAELVKTIQATMNADGNALVPIAEEKAAFGKVNADVLKPYRNIIEIRKSVIVINLNCLLLALVESKRRHPGHVVYGIRN